MKTFLPFCAAALLLAVSLPLSAAPDGDRGAVQRHELETQLQLLENNLSRQVEGTLRDEMGTQFQHLERQLSGQVEDAALATARQERRLTELENELRQLQEAREDNDSKRRQEFSAFAAAEADKVKAASDRYTSLISATFTALSWLTAIVLAIPIFLGFLGKHSFDKEAKIKLAEMNQKLVEMHTLVAKGQQYAQSLNNLLQNYQSTLLSTTQKEFPDDITQTAANAVRTGTGVEALRGAAVLAQNAQDWERACLYWEDVIKQDSQDEQSRFYLAFCQVQLGINPALSKEQRNILLNQAENYYQSRLPQTTSSDIPFFANLRISYAMLKEGKAKYASSTEESSKLLGEAYDLLQEVYVAIPDNTNILLLLAGCRYEQAKYANQDDKAQFLRERKYFLEKALTDSPEKLAIFQMLAIIYEKESQSALSNEQKISLLKKAYTLLQRAKILAPNDTKTLKLQAIIADKIINHCNDDIEKKDLINNLIHTLKEAQKIAPHDIEILGLLFLDTIKYIDLPDSNNEKAYGYNLQDIFNKIIELSPQNISHINNIVVVLCGIAQKSNRVKQDFLFQKAEILLSAIEKVAPFDSTTLKNFAALRIEQVREAEAQQREALLQQAEGYLDRILPSEQKTTLFNRACIAALRGQPDKALELLEECRQAGTLPSREHIESDKDMDRLRDQGAFKEFMERAYPANSSQTKDDTEDSE